MIRRALISIAVGLMQAGSVAAATHEVDVVNFAFLPAELVIQPGDTVRWRNMGGSHNVLADDGSFSNGPPSSAAWVYEVTFDEPGSWGYYCSLHGGPNGLGMAGTVVVEGEAPAPVFVIDEGVSGSWFDPGSPGQGILLEASAEFAVLSLAWFTWTTEGAGYDWLTGSGGFEGGTATLTLFRSSGGRFNDSQPVDTVEVGTATLRFLDCSTAALSFKLPAPQGSAEVQLSRVLPATPQCLESNPDFATR